MGGPALADPRLSSAGAVAELTIRIQNVSPRGGILRLSVYDKAHYSDNNSKPVASADVNAIAGETTITLHGIDPGSYAIETYQDINANGKMDTNWAGLPKEPFGFSRDARPRLLSKPSFETVKITLTTGKNTQSIHLQNSVPMTGRN